MSEGCRAESGSDVSPDVLLARAYLSRVGDPGCVPLWHLVRTVGPVEAAQRVRDRRVDQYVLADTSARHASADPHADLTAAERHGVRLVVPESPDWPHFAMAALERTGARRAHAFYELGHRTRAESGEPIPPVALWVRGPADLLMLGTRSVGMVGARAATAYGEHVTAELAFALAGREVIVVSGGAYGIDAAAHRAALAAEGTTVLVSAGGLDRSYPPGNSALFDRVAETGLLISESPPGCAPHRPRFLTRNRLIATFAAGVVVVEAARRSGAANTAGHARLLGRPLMAVPGPVTSPMSAGCHDLLRREVDRALLVTCADDVLAVVGSMGEGLDAPVEHGPRESDARAELDLLDPIARRVFEGLPARRFASAQEIAERSGVGPLDVIRALPTLDLADLLETGRSGYRIAARLRPPSNRGSEQPSRDPAATRDPELR